MCQRELGDFSEEGTDELGFEGQIGVHIVKGRKKHSRYNEFCAQSQETNSLSRKHILTFHFLPFPCSGVGTLVQGVPAYRNSDDILKIELMVMRIIMKARSEKKEKGPP